jgi:glutamate synthase domain-containing protein 2
MYLTFILPRNIKQVSEMINLLKKISWHNFFEANMRAATGKDTDRPYGRIGAIFSWDKILFNPRYLSRTPLNPNIKINTNVTLGPKALKPLQLKIPIIIGGMAYGSGYSLKAKIALAKAATMAGTAANSGNGPFLAEERRYADKYILQYPRGFWSKTEEMLKQADMIEIALGHSARGSAPVRVNGKKITEEVAGRYGTIPGLDVLMEARLPEVENIKQWKGLVQGLKEITGGVPIAVKFGATHYLERELALFVAGGIDVIVFDGLEGGTHGGASILMDDTGLPILPALCRAAKYLREQDLRGKVSLVVGGGLVTPGHFAKCLALGADAVIVGTITALAQSNTQTAIDVPWEPPTGAIYNDGTSKNKYDPDLGARSLANYFQSCIREMELLACTLGKTSLQDLDRADLVALDPLYAQIAEISIFN